MFRSLLTLAVTLAILYGAASAGDNIQDKKNRPVRGTIQKIDKDSSQGTVLTIAVQNKKKGDATTVEKEEKKFTVTTSTKVERVSGKKDNQTHEGASTDDLRTGQNVILVVKGDKLEKVEIVMSKKKK